MASEAFALRLGDANTNNNNLGDNQGGQKIDLESTVGDFNPVFEIKDAKFKNIDALVFAETMGLSYDEVIERMKLPEENPNHLEIFKSKSNISVEIGGKRIQLSPGQAAFIYGEHNIDFSTKVNDDGMLVEQFTIKDPTKVPASTLYNLKERFGELQTAADGGYLTSVEILLNGENVPESQREEIQNYYNQYLKSKGYPGSKVSWSN